MEAFVKCMEMVKPLSEQTSKPSLLPDAFQQENVIKKFEIILNDSLK